MIVALDTEQKLRVGFEAREHRVALDVAPAAVAAVGDEEAELALHLIVKVAQLDIASHLHLQAQNPFYSFKSPIY